MENNIFYKHPELLVASLTESNLKYRVRKNFFELLYVMNFFCIPKTSHVFLCTSFHKNASQECDSLVPYKLSESVDYYSDDLLHPLAFPSEYEI